MNWELVLGVLPWLLILACPLSMWWMMRGMSHGESCGKTKHVGNEGPRLAVLSARSTEQEIRELRERLARLEAEGRPVEGWQ